MGGATPPLPHIPLEACTDNLYVRCTIIIANLNVQISFTYILCIVKINEMLTKRISV